MPVALCRDPLRGMVALLLASLLIACGDAGEAPSPAGNTAQDGVPLTDRPAGGPRADDGSADDDFVWRRYETDVSGRTPTLCLVFSAALAPGVDYRPYVDIDAAVSLAVRRDALCMGGLGFGDRQDLTLRAGLPAADGRRLATDVRTTLAFEDRPAVVQFAGNGVVLPRLDADGLAVRTVNVEAVRVRISRVNDRALAFRSITRGFSAGAGEYAWLPQNERPGEIGSRIFEGILDTAGPANAPKVTVLPLDEAIGTLEPGAYFVELDDRAALDDRERGARAKRWLLVTDLAPTAWRGRDGIDVVVRSLDSAATVPGTRVDLVARSNEILARGTTDDRGHVRFDGAIARGEDADAPRLVLAYGPAGDFAVLDLDRNPVDLSAEDTAGRTRPGPVDGWLFTERGIYRPGETIHARGLLRDARARAITDRAGTLALVAPNGIETDRRRFAGAPRGGAVVHDFPVAATAMRGRWTLELAVDGVGVVAREAVTVEDFVPQRLALDLETDTDTALVPGDQRPVNAEVRFLYGAPGTGLPLSGTVRLERDPAPFATLDLAAGMTFGRHDDPFAETLMDLPEVVADGNGRATLPLSAGGRDEGATVPLRLRAVIRAREPGGRPVADDVRVPYRPQPVYLGLRAGTGAAERFERGTPARFDVLAVNRDGSATASPVEWRLARVHWDYDWYRTDGGRWRWRRSQRLVPLASGRVQTFADTAATIETRALDAGQYQLVAARHGEDLASTTFDVGWTRSGDDGAAPDRVRVTAPAEPVVPGAPARIGIDAPYPGIAEVVVATDRVLSVREVRVPAAGTAVEVGTDAAWGSGAWVMVTLYTDRDPVDRPVPRRAVGVAHIPLASAARHLDLALDAPATLDPDEPLAVTVTADGNATEETWVALAAVDEGILRLTDFAAPDPAAWFLARRRLGVDLHDDYGRLLDPNQGAAAPVRSGGDSIGGAGLSTVPTRTVALVADPVPLDANGSAELRFELPPWDGALRVMAVAWNDTALGAGAAPVTVRSPVATELALPRFLAPGDTLEATLSLDPVAAPTGEYNLALRADGPVTVEEATRRVRLTSGTRRDLPVTIAARSEGIARLGVRLTDPTGAVIERDATIEVRAPWLPVTRTTRARLAPDATFTPAAAALAGLEPASARLALSFANTPLDVGSFAAALDAVPWQCSEQLASRGTVLLAEDGATQQAALQSLVATLLSRQDDDGAIGLWRIGDRAAPLWVGIWITDFLQRAAAAGHPVPPAALDAALDALVPIADGDWWDVRGYDDHGDVQDQGRRNGRRLAASAYAGAVLARARRADASRLRWLHDDRGDAIDDPLARAQLAAGLTAIGDRARAASAFRAALDALGTATPDDGMNPYRSARRDLAGVLALLAEAGDDVLPEDDALSSLAERAGRDLPELAALTTQELAWLARAGATLGADRAPAVVADDGRRAVTAVTLTPAALEDPPTFRNTGDDTVWRTALARGVPTSAPPAESAGLRLERSAVTADGATVATARLARGDRFVILLEVAATTAGAHEVIVTDLLPAGLEIDAVLGPEDAATGAAYAALGPLSATRVTEARDDRFIAAVRLDGRVSARVAYLVRAVTPGDFARPGAVAEDMYRPAVHARTAPGRLVVTP